MAGALPQPAAQCAPLRPDRAGCSAQESPRNSQYPRLLGQLSKPKHWSNNLTGAGGTLNCTGCAASFSRLQVPTRAKSRLRSAIPSKSQESRNHFRLKSAQKQPTRNLVTKKRAGQEDVDSDYRFASYFHRFAFRSNILSEDRTQQVKPTRDSLSLFCLLRRTS